MSNSKLNTYTKIDSTELATIIGGKKDRHPIKHFLEGFLNAFPVILPNGESVSQTSSQTINKN